MSRFMVFVLLCLAMIMLSVVSARPFGRHRHHNKSQSSEESSNESDQFRTPFDGNDRFPFGHHRHGGHHHHEFGRPCHHDHGFGPGHSHDHGHGFGFDHPHHHPNGGHGSNANYDNFKSYYNFEPNRHDPPFGFLHHIFGIRGNVATNFNAPNGPFPFSATNWPNQFGQPPNNFPNIFNPFANWPITNGGNVNIPPQQPQFTTTTIPVLDPTSILENNDNNNDSKDNESSSDNSIILNSSTNDGGNGGDSDAVVNNQNPTSIATSTSGPIQSVTSNVNQAVTATVPNEQTNTDYFGLIDVRFGDGGSGGNGHAVTNNPTPTSIETIKSLPSTTSNVEQSFTRTTPHVQTSADYLGLIDDKDH